MTGQKLAEPNEILEVIKQQYDELFKSEGICLQNLQQFLAMNNFPKLNNEQKLNLDAPFTEEEVKESIHALQGNKTPGFDSIPIEFYWKFSDLISKILCFIFNSYLHQGKMYDSAYTGIISLMYKGAGDRSLRENWRPLTLLNVDYKIYAKVLARRLDKVMTTLVHPDQTSSVSGRTIKDSIAHVMSVIHYADNLNADAMILSVDHQAAFDMVEWPFIFETFKAMNFGPNFISYVGAVYKQGKVRSAVNVNGFISEFFEISRGIRQGCPFSALAYNATSEVLAHYIRTTRMISGIPLCGTNCRITKYADDTSLFLSRWDEIDSVFQIFENYKLASGSRLKHAKTQLLLLGTLKNSVVPLRFTNFVVQKMKLYGIYFDSSGFDDDQNWEKCNETILKLERRMPPYGVSLFGKMHFIQIYYLCMFNYLIGMLTPSFDLVNRTNKAMIRFLWFPSDANFIAQDVLKLSPLDGGVGLPDLEVRTKVNRLMFFIRVLSSKEELSWRRCFWHFYRKVENLSQRQLARIDNCPIIYKEIRIAVIESKFRQDRDFCWIFGKKFSLANVKSNNIYGIWIKDLFLKKIVKKHNFWSNNLGLGASAAYIKLSWTWSKAKYVDGRARNIHYRFRHLSLYTNNRLSIYKENVQPHCTYCFLQRNIIVREDNYHVFMLCERVIDFYYYLTPILSRIAQINNIASEDLILGRKMDDKARQNCFNFIIQHGQLAIWSSRVNLENNFPNQNVLEIFQKNIFQNLCRVKTVVSNKTFFQTFSFITQRSNSVIGFRINI